jgi:glycosyltransferase involved in cell wall biosynthesis
VLQHVVIVTDSLSVDGGSAKVALSSALALAESGLQVTVFAAAGQASDELAACHNVRVICTGQGEALASRDRLRGALRGLWNRRAWAKMNALLATLDPQQTVVHVHAWTKALSSSVVASIVRAKFPLVLTLHEYFTACPTGCLYLHRDRQVCTLRPMSLACIIKDCDSRSYAFKLYRVLRGWIQRYAGAIPGGIEHFITVSPFSRLVLEPLLPAHRRFHAVANPVDATRGPRSVAENNAGFVFVGRLSAEKGGLLLAEAAKLAGVNVTFVGDGPERGAIERANPQAAVTGWVDRDAVLTYLRAARALVVPSLWYETLGLVVLEAAALGTPAIVPRDTAPADLVRFGETGLSFARGNVTELAAQLRTLDDDALVARMSRAAYARFWSNPRTMDAHLQDLIATYEGVLGVPSGAEDVQHHNEPAPVSA